jgi:hypothetical protein
VRVEGGAHNIGWTHPEEVNRALLEFLDEPHGATRRRGMPRGGDTFWLLAQPGRDADWTALAADLLTVRISCHRTPPGCQVGNQRRAEVGA